MNTIVTSISTAYPVIRPLKDRVLVRRLGPPVQQIGSLWIPETAQENTKWAQVLACGPKVTGVKPGDEVLVPGAAEKYPDWEQLDFLMIQEADIGGIRA
jgi:co-chaperonin GroES (HSP10)